MHAKKYVDYTKDSRQHMDDMCLIKIAVPQRFSHIWNELENGTILGESTNMYRKTIAKAYGVIFKYKTT